MLRMTVAAVIMMLAIMTFRLPGAALGAYYLLVISRDNPHATIDGTITLLSGISLGLANVLLGGILFSGSPLLHFLWLIASLLVTFFLISAATQYGFATSFGFLVISSIPIWDFPANTDTAVSNTLYAALAVSTGAAITLSVELIFSYAQFVDVVQENVVDRLRVTAEFLRNVGNPPGELKSKLVQYADTGTGYLRRLLARSESGRPDYARKAGMVVLSGRLIDLSAGLATSETPITESERIRFAELAGRIDQIREFGALSRTDRSAQTRLHAGGRGFLELLESTVQLMHDALLEPALVKEFIAQDEPPKTRILKADAWTNSAHVKFALRGAAAALVCYLAYHLLDWRGLYNSVSTCMVTALSTAGSSRQKQILRVTGAVIGGLFFGIASEIVILPHMDSITGFLLLYVAVTAFSVWFATSSPRLSYFGLQVAFAFYIVQLRTFSPDTQLTPARDNVAGILLGLMAMWVVFDQLTPHNSMIEMKQNLARSIRMIVAFMEDRDAGAREAYLKRVRGLRDSINDTLHSVRNSADAVLLEFGSHRAAALKLRGEVRAWQPEVRTLFLLQITLAQMRLRLPEGRLPAPVEEAQKLCARYLETVAGVLDGGVVIWETHAAANEIPTELAQSSVAGFVAGDSLTIAQDLLEQVQNASKN